MLFPRPHYFSFEVLTNNAEKLLEVTPRNENEMHKGHLSLVTKQKLYDWCSVPAHEE